MSSRFLVFGHDTIECAYYLERGHDCTLDFENLAAQKELIRTAKNRHPTPIVLGNESFLLRPNGTGSGYPFLIENEVFSVEFGEFNKPNFFVTFRSIALWEFGAERLHQRFIDWAASIGMKPYRPESLSRVDFTFDFQIEEMDFDLESFVAATRKDAQFRKCGKVQTYNFGSGHLLARFYNKVDEIEEKSHKTWFYDIWGCNENVWRFEWQVRKEMMKLHSIRTFDDLKDGQAELLEDVLRNFVTLRTKTGDSNQSRWPLHPIWLEMLDFVGQMEKHSLSEIHAIDHAAYIEDKLARISISVYGYMKRFAAIKGIQSRKPDVSFDEAFDFLRLKLDRVHDDFDWQLSVKRRYDEMSLG